METRVGIGFDVHKFVSGRPLILGGVKIPFPFGLAGHSDADVLLHALADALLGTIGKGDIGTLFPDTDPEIEGIDSADIICCVREKLRKHKARVIWIDSIVIAEKPKILPYVDLMRSRIAEMLFLDFDRISIKGKTTETLGFVGRGEGIAAQVIATVRMDYAETE
ncbi:2-C-methyl-D-erythritol 2,4-cyclodiphosphate synthase [bacterium]|nr:2-C-methyl-D-erythritol 2,4-cyclodiphosphate synthase [bacterium]